MSTTDRIAELPKGASWIGLCSIGFTMSLFVGSLLSGLAGYLLLYFTAKKVE